ncbi:MAG TPA: ABC transporter permease, partial [Candidatus Polarisedimenticolia bacterium]|nr:ABC transporter permease [Candidatus Polarisedimenticolia bacterium]
MERLLQDLRHAFRGLRRSPGFAAAAVLMLAVGIGGSTAVFTIVNALLLRPLPYRDPGRLVWIWATRTDRDKAFYSIPNFIDTRDHSRTLEEMAGLANWSANLTGNGETERLVGIRLTANGCRMLGVEPVLGRVLGPEDVRPESPRVVLLSHGVWKRRFGADPGVVGRTAILSGESYLVVGILPPDFLVPGSQTDMVVPLDPTTDPRRLERGSNFLRVIARLGPGVTSEQAAADLAEITRGLARDYPEPNGKLTAPRVVPLQEEVVGGYRLALCMLLGAVTLVLLIACSNVAGLLVARAAVRRKELAVRAALGAGRLDLVRQLLAESGLLALAAGGLGLLLAWWCLDLLSALGSMTLPRAGEIALDARILWFTLGLSIASGLLFGVAPALRASRIDLMDSIRHGGSGGRPRSRLRDL